MSIMDCRRFSGARRWCLAWIGTGLLSLLAAGGPAAAVTVCSDGGGGGYEAFPDVCRLSDGRLMVVFYDGFTHISLPNAAHPKGGRISAVFSGDEGATWSAPQVVYDGPDDDRDPSITALRDGRLLCAFFSLRAATNGHTGLGSWLVESGDQGRTWSEPRRLSERYYCSSPVREMGEGVLLLGLYREDDGVSAGAVIRSEDGGRTWGPVVDIDHAGRRLDAETDLVRLGDNTLLAVQRAPEKPMCFARSRDGGRSWSKSEPIGFPGHSPYLLRTSEGILLLAHRLPQTSLHWSLDDAKTWRGPERIDQCIGAYPSMVELRDGSVLVVYYEEGGGSNIRARRLRATREGIRWLAPGDAPGASGTGLQEGWSGMDVAVGSRDDLWRVSGRRRVVEVRSADLQMTVQAGATWRTVPSGSGDLKVRRGAEVVPLRLAEATRREFLITDTGAWRGFTVVLDGFGTNAPADLRLRLSVGLEGADEELVCGVSVEGGAEAVVECCWPPAVDPGSFDSTVVPFMQGMFLPKDWPRKVWLYETLTYGRGLYMPWWGHQQGGAGMVLILETPMDAGCHFEHPAGGPTRLQPRWVHSLGRFDEPRRARLCFFESGNYVDMAKRYRRYAMDTGNFVSLKQKIARNPQVGRLVGTPVIHTSILYHIQPESSYYHKDDPARNDEMVTFDARAEQLRKLQGRGVKRAYVHLDGWGFRGYDNLHPDVLPPCPAAGGWDGMRRLAEACEEVGYLFALHDQYRDYYFDARSYDARNALVEENGRSPEHSTWYGGRQTFLCPSLAPAHVHKNHQALLAQGVKVRGVYLDVFSVVLPDECYQPEHLVSRAACLRFRGDCLESVRAWGGIVSSEEPSAWSIPHLDLVHHGPYPTDPSPGQGQAMGVPVPLFSLVYHDALLVPWSLGRGAWGIPEKDLGFLHGVAHAGLPYLSLEPDDGEREQVRVMAALHERVGLRELTQHVFLDDRRRQQRFTYADGTRVTIDLDADRFEIEPPL